LTEAEERPKLDLIRFNHRILPIIGGAWPVALRRCLAVPLRRPHLVGGFKTAPSAGFGIITVLPDKRRLSFKIVFFPTLEIHHG